MDPTDDPPTKMQEVRRRAACLLLEQRAGRRHYNVTIWNHLDDRDTGIERPDDDPYEVNDRGAAFARMKRGF